MQTPYDALQRLEVTAYKAATSAVLWSTELPLLSQGDELSAFVPSPDGTRLYAAISSFSSSGAQLLVGVDAATGAEVFQSDYDPPSVGLDGNALRALAVSPDGSRLYAVGGSGFGIFPLEWACSSDTTSS